jgi:threonine/homoserine/homoserine lactone efflux protein
MDTAALALFIPACFALNMAPGPNNLLSLSNAVRFGFRQSCLGGLGRLVAFAAMILISSAGLAAVLHTSAWLFEVIRILGAAYLLYLAIRLWRTETAQEVRSTSSVTGASLIRQEFLVAAGNPKAILIFTAFLPQFVNLENPVTPQFAVLGALFLALECVAIAAYACMGLHVRRWLFQPRARRIFNRSCATLLAGASFGLLASRR